MLTTTTWAAAGLGTISILILALYVAAHEDSLAGARGMLLAIGTAGVATAAVTVLAGLCVRPVLDRLAGLRRDRRGSTEVAQLRGEIAALRGEQAAVREEMQRLVATIAVCGTKLAGLPEDVAEQIRPLTDRVTALEEQVEDRSTAEAIVARAIGAGGSVTPLRTHNGYYPGAG